MFRKIADGVHFKVHPQHDLYESFPCEVALDVALCPQEPVGRQGQGVDRPVVEPVDGRRTHDGREASNSVPKKSPRTHTDNHMQVFLRNLYKVLELLIQGSGNDAAHVFYHLDFLFV